MHKDNDAYLEAAGQYYELSEIMEKEKQAMIANMLDVRESLERANKKASSFPISSKSWLNS